MQKSEKFFIFSWKELVVIGLLILTSVGFFFTLGLHYGKKLHPDLAVTEAPSTKLEESPDVLPAKETLDQGSQHAEPAAQDAIRTATQEAIAHSNLKVEQPKPVELPKEKAEKSETEARETPTPKPLAKFSVQLGSYPSKKEAQLKIGVLNKRGLKPEIRTAEVNGQTRYRVVLPGFKTKQIADAHGRELKAKRKIENFVTIKSE